MYTEHQWECHRNIIYGDMWSEVSQLTCRGLLWNQKSSWYRRLVFSTSLLCRCLRSPEPWRCFTGASPTDTGLREQGCDTKDNKDGGVSIKILMKPSWVTQVWRVPVVCAPLLQDHVSPPAGYRIPAASLLLFFSLSLLPSSSPAVWTAAVTATRR